MKSSYWKVGVAVAMVCMLLVISCGKKKSETAFKPQELSKMKAGENIEPGAGVKTGGKTPGVPGTKYAVTAEEQAVATTEPGFERIVETFLVIMDASGSKYLPHSQQVKLKVGKNVLRKMNPHIPDWPLTGGLRRYGFEAGAWTERTKLLWGVGSYSRSAFAEAIEILRWAGGKSPMAEAIDAGTEDLRPTSGLISVIIVSDGIIKDNDPIKAAQRMKAEYGDRLCIYTVQVGHDRYGERLLDDVVEVGQCGFAVNADELLADDNVMRQWVDDVFHHRQRAKKPREAPCVDSDQDGVCDDQDECPDTPPGVKVDERGCWIIDKVYFDLNKWNIKPEYYATLDEIARALLSSPRTRIEVQGHTCNIWTEKYNMKLSNWRATSVANYLMKKGVPSHQLVLKGFGMTLPAESNKTEQGRSLNRRAEFNQIRR